MQKLFKSGRAKKILRTLGRLMAVHFAGVAAAAVIGVSSLFVPVGQAMPETMPVSELHEGMTGTAYTVIDSSGEIVPFGVEIIGVISGGKGSQTAILARASGPVIDSSGGIVHGMSGSPVYIDGRLIGAAAATLKDMEASTFIITPIGDMLRILELPDNKRPAKPELIDIKKVAADREKAMKKLEEKEAARKKKKEQAQEAGVREKENKPSDRDGEKQKAPEPEKRPEMPLSNEKLPSAGREPEYKWSFRLPADPLAAPAANMPVRALLCAGGFGAEGNAYLAERLRPLGYGIVPVAGTAGNEASNTNYNAVLEPGGSVGVAVVYGDFSVGGMGTVTAVDGNRMVGFGHAMTNRGNVSYFMTEADIIGMVKGPTDGMKIGNVRKVIGRVNQDRSTGIAGIIGEYPSVVGVRVKVDDKTSARSESYAASIAYDESLLPLLTNGIAYSALSKTADSQVASTVKVHFDIMTDAGGEDRVERSNMFYAEADTGKVAFNELAEAMLLVCANADRESNVFDVKVDIETEAARRTATIVSATPDRPRVRPGDTVIFKTVIKPYRGEKVKLDIPFTIPENRRDGEWHLDMHGGGLVAVTQVLAEGLVLPDAPIETTEEKLAKMLERHSNNEIIIEPGAAQRLMSEKEQKAAIKEAVELSKMMEQGKEPPPPPVSVFPTDYIIENVIHATVTVDRKAEPPEEKKPDGGEKKEDKIILKGIGKEQSFRDLTALKPDTATLKDGSAAAADKNDNGDKVVPAENKTPDGNIAPAEVPAVNTAPDEASDKKADSAPDTARAENTAPAPAEVPAVNTAPAEKEAPVQAAAEEKAPAGPAGAAEAANGQADEAAGDKADRQEKAGEALPSGGGEASDHQPEAGNAI